MQKYSVPSRLAEVVKILASEGFGHFLYDTEFFDGVAAFERVKHFFGGKKDPPEVRLRRVFEKLGPTYIKIGQFLSTRPDLLPPSYLEELEKLQAHVPEVSWQLIEQQIERELGKPLKKVFKEFETAPLAAGSIAQVYRATLRSGKKVAVKVQRPSIEELIAVDFEVLALIAKGLANVEQFQHYRLETIIHEMKNWAGSELDFRIEANNMQEFREIFDSWEVIVPQVYVPYTTKRLIVMEFIHGHRLVDCKKPEEHILRWFQASLYSTLNHGLFHADPHPGNFIVTRNNKLALIDFGIVGKLDEWLRNYVLELVLATLDGDDEKIVQLLIALSDVRQEPDRELLGFHVRHILRQVDVQVGAVHTGIILQQVISAAYETKLIIPPQLVLFAKLLVTLEGVSKQHAPNLNFYEESREFLMGLALDRARDKYSITKKAAKLATTLLDIPGSIKKVLTKLEEGSIKLHIQDTDIKHLSDNFDVGSKRVSYTILCAAFIISGTVSDAFTFTIGQYSFPLSALFYAASGLVLLELALQIKKRRKR